MLRLGDALLDEEEHKTGRDEGHGEDHADRHDHVRGGSDSAGDDKVSKLISFCYVAVASNMTWDSYTLRRKNEPH